MPSATILYRFTDEDGYKCVIFTGSEKCAASIDDVTFCFPAGHVLAAEVLRLKARIAQLECGTCHGDGCADCTPKEDTAKPHVTVELSSALDMEIIRKHDPSVRGRAMIELAIVNALIQAAKDNGYRFEGEDIDTGNDDDLKSSLFNLDDCRLHLFDSSDSYVGWIFLVFGNDGYDLVSDYTTNLETFLAPVSAVAESWGS